MAKNNIESPEILKTHDLRLTRCRKEILDFFISHKFALSQPVLENSLSDKYDRVTIYRTLRSFLNNGVIHKVLDDDGILKFALCTDQCNEHHHNHEHIHFKCRDCGKTFCLSDSDVPRIQLPPGFQMEGISILATGVCNRCNR